MLCFGAMKSIHTQRTTLSERFKRFLGLLAILTIISLVVMNDFTTILESEEAFNILCVQQQMTDSTSQSLAPFPNTSQYLIYSVFGFSPFWIRLSNVIVFLLLLLGIRIWGARIFGKEQIMIFIITIVSSFLLISMSKFAVADIPLCAFHTMSMIFLVICLKQPKLKWQIVYGLFVMGSFLVQPTSAVIYGVGLLIYMLLFHKEANNLLKPAILAIWLLLISVFYFLGGFSWTTEGFIFSYQTSWKEYFTWQVIGLLPWFGFLPAALWDLFQKLRKKEEMAIILTGWLLLSLLSHALILQLCLLFLIARQIVNYFKPNYPYKGLVKAFAIVNLVFTFFALLAVMFGGFAAMHNVGFRTAAVFSAIYWIFGFVGILGLFSDNRKYIIGGFTFAGAFSLMLFWVQLNPIINRYRDINTQLLGKLEKGQKVILSQSIINKNQFKVYGNAKELEYSEFDGEMVETDYYILEKQDYEILQSKNDQLIVSDTLNGRTHIFAKPGLFFIVKNRN